MITDASVIPDNVSDDDICKREPADHPLRKLNGIYSRWELPMDQRT